MPDSIMYQEDGYVVLEADNPEQFMEPEELQNKLKDILLSGKVEMPRELTKLSSIDEKAKYLMENYFELDVEENNFLQWYVVRWEK